MKAIDLFAGFGGLTEGATQAGAEVIYAANHWPTAVQVHQSNHPHARHECQDLRQADWTKLPDYELLLAAPACQGHSTASQPKRRGYHDALRATAWAVVDCAEVTEPRAFLVENVPAFLSWKLYPMWKAALETLGYRLQTMKLTASYFGAPQRRERLFVVGLRNRNEIRLEPAQEEQPFAPCIDWSADGWRPITDATPLAQARFAKGRANHGRRFLSQHVTGHPGVPLHEPIRTITCAKNHWTLVDGNRYRYLTTRELARGMGFPDSYTWPEELSVEEVTRGLGNAVCPPQAKALVSAVMEAA